MKQRTPERFQNYQTAEGSHQGDGIPPCPESIKGRQARELWAKTAAILSIRRPMEPVQIAYLERAILTIGTPESPSPSALARRVRAMLKGSA